MKWKEILTICVQKSQGYRMPDKKGYTYSQMAITLEQTVQGDDTVTNVFMH